MFADRNTGIVMQQMRKIVSDSVVMAEICRQLADGMKVEFTPKGVSMLPFIRGGRDSVVLARPGELIEGDIVLARLSSGSYVLHRIISIDGPEIVLMGDGNIHGVEKCSVGDVIAVSERIIRNGKAVECRSEKHLRKVAIWQKLRPVRRYLLAIYKRIIL